MFITTLKKNPVWILYSLLVLLGDGDVVADGYGDVLGDVEGLGVGLGVAFGSL